VAATLTNIAPIISLILIILGGIIYGLAQAQPAEVRGKWQNVAISMFIGGLVIAIIAGAAELIQSTASQALTPV
jgi:hypothetical protein